MSTRLLVNFDPAPVLTRYGWLSRTPADFQRVVIENCVVQRRDAGDPLYYHGDEVGGMFGVLSGTIEIASELGNADANIVHLASTGFWIGEASIVTGRPRRISASARTDAVVAYLSLAALNNIVNAQPAYWRQLAVLAIEHTAFSTGGGVDLMIRNVERRCIAVLLRVCGCRYRTPESDLHPEAVVTHEELAAMANLSRNAVGEVLRKLSDAGQIELGYRSVLVKAPEALRLMLNAD